MANASSDWVMKYHLWFKKANIKPYTGIKYTLIYLRCRHIHRTA